VPNAGVGYLSALNALERAKNMPGRPKTRRDLELLEDLPEDMVFAMFEAGKPVSVICYELGIGRRALEKWIEANDRDDMIARARAKAADELACETLAIADSADPEHAAHARVRIQTRQWLAEKWKPSVYGAKQAQVQVNIHSMRMDALRHAEVIEVELSTGQDK
jgi:hypothetical protein